MSKGEPTYIGQVASVTGATVRVRLRADLASSLTMIDGESYRIGQVGAFLRIPLGYTSLFGICTTVGADAAPPDPSAQMPAWEVSDSDQLAGFRWLSIALFGESVGKKFERGISQYPTVGDEVHLVTTKGLEAIYRASDDDSSVPIGFVANSPALIAEISLAGLVTRHSAVVGSTGSGKSTFVNTIIQAIINGNFPTYRALIIDPHGEYSDVLGESAHVFKVNPDGGSNISPLRVPFWALDFEQLRSLTLGTVQQSHQTFIRETVRDLKLASVQYLGDQPEAAAVTADSPIPFSVRKLWHDLDEFENRTYSDSQGANAQTDATKETPTQTGYPETFTRTKYPPATTSNTPPYANRAKRNIARQLENMLSKIRDAKYSFLFDPDGGYSPDIDGNCSSDLDELVSEWIGHDDGLTILDVSEVPSDVRTLVVGTMLKIIYNSIYWAQRLPIGGKEQPLLIVVDEAHIFMPKNDENQESESLGSLSMIAKEGRKYGVGLMVVSQRPSELHPTILSQVGTMVALRTTNSTDHAAVSRYLPDELGPIASMLPALRTGEGIFMGEALPVPTRVRIKRTVISESGGDSNIPDGWRQEHRPNRDLYKTAITNWRKSSFGSTESQNSQEENNDG